MEPIKTLHVPHLGGIQVGYRLSSSTPDKSKPTLVLFNPFTATADYYLPEFQNKALCETANLLAIEPLGHGFTHLKNSESFTYWDTAIMALQLLDTLGIEKVFALGTSQGGWIAARMAILAPKRIQGVIPVGCSMDYESPQSRELGCWDGPTACEGLLTLASDLAPAPDEFEPGDGYYEFILRIGFGETIDDKTRTFWTNRMRDLYRGDEGKKRICMAAVALAGRDGLKERLGYITCPVLWFQGTSDVVFSVRQAEKDIKQFTNSPSARLIVYDGGVHFLSWTHKKEIHDELIKFIQTWKNGEKAVL